MNSERARIPAPGERRRLHGVDWAVHAGAAEEVMLGTRRAVRRRRQNRLVAAGALAAVAMGAVIWLAPWSKPNVPQIASAAVIALPARQVLPDGSAVELKDGAEISVAYSSVARRVILLRGEAHFEVVPNQARPFIVAVDAVEVRAVGTAFSVQRRATEVDVLVATGRVAVDRVAKNAVMGEPPAPETIATLDAGHHSRIEVAPTGNSPVVEAISPAEMQQRLAWRMPRLEFTRTPLTEAVAMINRHSATKISLADPSLGEVRISGLLHADNVESLLRLLELEHGIKAEHRSSGDVVLRPAR